MPLQRLNRDDIEKFLGFKEVAMGLQVVQSQGDFGWLAYVIGDLVLLTLDSKSEEQLADLLNQPWMKGAPRVTSADRSQEREFEEWLQSLPEAEPQPDPIPRSDLAAYGLIVPPYLPPAPARPSTVYGHLPFGWRCGPTDVFYRYEPWPTSRRVNQRNRSIRLGTYASPASELPFNPTGFAAVARYALPNLLPACFRWELQPIAGTQLNCGASVPLFGQSGGGVEVYFRSNATNRGPIANPIQLPPL